MSGDILTSVAERSICITLLACQCLGELIAGEVTNTAHANHLVEDFQVGIVGRTIQRFSAHSRSLHLYLVILEVGLLQNNCCTVRECQFLITKEFVLSFLDNLSSLDFGDVNQWFILDIVHVCLNLLSTGSSNGGSHLLFSRIALALLLLSPLHDNEIAVRNRNQFREQLVDCSNGDVRCNLLHHLIENIQWGNRLVSEIVVTILIAKLGVSTLVTVSILLLQGTHIVCLGASILRSGETKLANTLSLTIESLKRLHILTFLRYTYQLKAVLGLRQQILTVVSVCLEEGAALFLCHLVQAETHHARDDIGHIALNKIADIVFLLFGNSIMLHHNHYLTHLHLLILVEDIDGLVVVGNSLCNNLRSVGINLDTTE